ncbi:MAG: 50S ribosomal protein L21 [Eubacteriales bacterium]
MYAIIATGGKQHKVAVGDTIYVEKLDVADGKKVQFDTLMYSDGKKVTIGTPLVKGVTVEGKVLKQVKGKKVIVFKYKPKKNIRKKQGHRQKYTAVEITGIKAAEAK